MFLQRKGKTNHSDICLEYLFSLTKDGLKRLFYQSWAYSGFTQTLWARGKTSNSNTPASLPISPMGVWGWGVLRSMCEVTAQAHRLRKGMWPKPRGYGSHPLRHTTPQHQQGSCVITQDYNWESCSFIPEGTVRKPKARQDRQNKDVTRNFRLWNPQLQQTVNTAWLLAKET